MTTLITAANSAQAQQLKNILAIDDVLLGDHQDIPALLIKSGKFLKTPDPKGSAFVHQMLAFCLDKGITRVYALRRSELLPLAEASQLFAEYGITLYIPSTEVVANNMPHNIINGQIIIIENGKVIYGSLPPGANWNGATNSGVFKVNAEDYIIFTAD